MENHEPFGAKWSMFCRLKVRSYVLAANVAGTLKVAPLQILKFPVVLPHKFLDAEKFNLRFSDASEITEIADKLRWYRYQKGLRQRDAADYAGIDRSTYIHYEEAGRDFYPKEHMEKLAELFEVPVDMLLDMNLVGPNSARSICKTGRPALNAGLLVCYVLLLRFQMLHGGVYQFQLLLRGAGQILDGFQRLLGLELRQLLPKLLLRLL